MSPGSGSTVRLDRLLSNLGYASRREVDGMARQGRIVLDGEPVGRADARVALGPDLPQRLRIDGEPADPPPGLVLAMNKPPGVTCSHKEAGPLVYALLPPRWRRREPAISTVGRLDKDTSGLLILTDDGDLLHRIISPRSAVPKRYRATLARPLPHDAEARLAAGTLLLEGDPKPLSPAGLTRLAPTEVEVIVTEGRYHLVRRMVAALGSHVVSLHRDAIGGLPLPGDLGAGAWRLLSPVEIAAIFVRPTR